MKNRDIALALLGLAALIGALVWAFQPRSDDERVEPEEVETQETTQADAASILSDRPTRHLSAASTSIARPTNDTGEALSSRDARHDGDRGPPKTTWDDPVNELVLGENAWMAPIDDAEAARVDQVFEDARAARFDPRLPDRSRAESIVVAREIVETCFDELERRSPGASGRLIVSWTAAATDGVGTITDPQINVNYKLEDAAFEACVVDGLTDQTFAGADGEPITVEVPFFFDGAF